MPEARFASDAVVPRFHDWRAERCDAVEDGETELEFGGLTVEVAALQRFVPVRPVSGLAGGDSRSAPASQLPRWIDRMNPSSDLCDRASLQLFTTFRHTKD